MEPVSKASLKASQEDRDGSSGSATDDDDDDESLVEDGVHLLRKLPKRLREAESSAIPRHHENREIGLVPKLALLIFKCLKMLWRRKILVGLELMCPIIGLTMLSIYTTTLELDNDRKPIIYSPFGYDPVNLKTCKLILVTPSSSYVDEIITELRQDKTDSFHLNYDYVSTIDFDARLNDGSLCAVINFLDLPDERYKPLPTTIRYELRLPAVPKYILPHKKTGEDRRTPIDSQWQPRRVYPSGIKVGPRNRYDSTGGSPGYYTEGFLYLQHKIDCLLLRLIYAELPVQGQLPLDVCSDLNILPHFQRFPYPPYQHVNLLPIVAKWLPFVLAMSYIVLFSVNTWLLVREKELGMKGFLEYYNVWPWQQWLSWIVCRMTLQAIAVIVLSFILTGDWAYNRGIINKSSASTIYLFLLTYVLSCLCTSCFFSTLFNRAQSACVISVAIWIVSYLPSVQVDSDIAPNTPRPHDQYFSIPAAIIYCLTANFGLSYGCQLIANAEINSKGISMETLYTERFDLGHVMLCMNITSFIFILLSMYIEQIAPTSIAKERPLPFLYFTSLRWWKGNQLIPTQSASKSSTVTPRTMEVTHHQFFEKNPKKNDRDVEISLTSATLHLPGDVGISKINLRCVNGEIVAILGPKKSGKTALCNVCAGLLPVSSGSVFLKKRHMINFMRYARSNIGICPQVNALYDYLTVEEHLSFFVQLKGVIVAADAYEEIQNLILSLDLNDIRKVPAKNLSPGQKRLVHIGMAFASGSKIVLLDEPTEGMDVPMKRTAWRFFDGERPIRTILLFTKDTEEASYVGNRVLVMINGEVYVRGTPSFIKTTFDGGYHLELTKDLTKFDVAEILAMTKKVMPRSKLLYNGYQEARLLLPDEYTPFFPSFFETLQAKKLALGIKEILISFVPFEEILKKIMRLSVKDSDLKTKVFNVHWKKLALYSKIVMPLKSKADILASTKEKKIFNYFRQFFVLFLGNARFMARHWKWFMISASFAFTFALFGPFALEKQGFSKLEPIGSVELNFKNFENPRVLFKCYDKYKLHADFCESVRTALKDMGLGIDNATEFPMDQQLLLHYVQTVAAQDLPYELAVDVKFRHFENDVILYFDNEPLHVLPTGSLFFTKLLYLRMRASTISQFELDSPPHEIQVINRPLPYTIPQRLRIARSFGGPEVLMGTVLAWGTVFYLPSLAFQFPEEKRFKMLLKNFSVNIYIFWFAKVTWNFSILLLLSACIGPVYYLFGYVGFDSIQVIVTESILLTCYGICAISHIYALSFVPFVVRNVRNCFFYLWMMGFVMGPIPWSLMQILTEELYDEQDSTRPWLRTLNQFLMLFPGYALAVGTHRVALVSVYESQCVKLKPTERICDKTTRHPCCDVQRDFQNFSRFGILQIELFFLFEAVLMFALIFLLESSFYQTIRNKLEKYKLRWKLRRRKIFPALKDWTEEDSTLDFSRFVGKDAKAVGFEVFLNNLCKKNEEHTVVDRLTLGILKNQSFGFVGNVGSGVTSVLQLLSGFSFPTSGDITIDDISLVKNYEKYVSQVSFCPKDHMLHLAMTGRETLTLIGTIKRVPPERLKELIKSLSSRLGLEPILDKLVMNYDLGSRRKLSFALSLIGKPRVLILEEPFHEIDPDSRDQMMNVLLHKRGHTTIILSSSNMELSVTFCDRIALLIDGKLACMGSPDFLTQTYSKGITIIIQLVPEDYGFYSKKGIVYHYEKPKGSDDSESDTSGEEDKMQPQQQGQTKLPKIVVTKTEDTARIDPKPDTNFLTKPGPTGLHSSRSTDSTASRSTSSGSSMSFQSSSGVEDALWEQELDPIMEYMEDNFPSAVLFDKSVCYLHYHLPGDDLDLADIFKKMEIARIGFELEAYRVGTGTLAQLLGSYTTLQPFETKEDD